MKKFSKIILLTLTLIAILATSVFAGENDYIVSKELVYESVRNTVLPSGFVEILVGNTNFVQYQKDNELVITPMPDEMREDEFEQIIMKEMNETHNEMIVSDLLILTQSETQMISNNYQGRQDHL